MPDPGQNLSPLRVAFANLRGILLEFVSSGVLALLQLPVQFCPGGFHIGSDIEDFQNAKGEGTEDMPAQEGQLQHKGVPLLPLHHLLTQADGIHGIHIRIIRQDVRHHQIGIAFDNAGDQQQQAPQEGEQIRQKYGGDHLSIPAAEGIAQLMQGSGLPAVAQEEPAGTDSHGVAQENAQRQTHQQGQPQDAYK